LNEEETKYHESVINDIYGSISDSDEEEEEEGEGTEEER